METKYPQLVARCIRSISCSFLGAYNIRRQLSLPFYGNLHTKTLSGRRSSSEAGTLASCTNRSHIARRWARGLAITAALSVHVIDKPDRRGHRLEPSFERRHVESSNSSAVRRRWWAAASPKQRQRRQRCAGASQATPNLAFYLLCSTCEASAAFHLELPPILRSNIHANAIPVSHVFAFDLPCYRRGENTWPAGGTACRRSLIWNRTARHLLMSAVAQLPWRIYYRHFRCRNQFCRSP